MRARGASRPPAHTQGGARGGARGAWPLLVLCALFARHALADTYHTDYEDTHAGARGLCEVPSKTVEAAVWSAKDGDSALSVSTVSGKRTVSLEGILTMGEDDLLAELDAIEERVYDAELKYGIAPRLPLCARCEADYWCEKRHGYRGRCTRNAHDVSVHGCKAPSADGTAGVCVQDATSDDSL